MLLNSAAIQALAEDGQYVLLETLRKRGPSTADALNADVPKLANLAAAGLATGPDEEDRWEAVGRGLFLEIPADPEGQAVTPDELNDLQARVEQILEPYVNRPRTTDATHRDVRILSYFLPSAE